ncbi:MAG: 4-hydroxy-tetrahydrodipicolinate synthase [Phycisphaerales bacterium]|nr:4-hydroxy-tetrahydrodipicolinate synthase [Phycisphaerales bacterium]
MSSNHSFLKGVGVALVTPFNKSTNQIDWVSLSLLLEHVIAGGVDYLVIMGTTGETPTINSKEKHELLHFVYEKVNNRKPIVVGVTGYATSSVIDEFKVLPLHDAQAILTATPYYNKPSQEGLLQHFTKLSEHAPKPLILYNVPGRTGRNLNVATIAQLANDCKNIIAIKEASGDMHQSMFLVKECPSNFRILSGDDNLAIAQIAIGFQGVISVVANVFPQVFGTLIHHALHNRFDEARKLHIDLLACYDLLFVENNPAGIKAFLHEQKIIKDNYLRLPLTCLQEKYIDNIRTYLEKYKHLK